MLILALPVLIFQPPARLKGQVPQMHRKPFVLFTPSKPYVNREG